MILVVGATGLVGSEICRRLHQLRKPVRALVRRDSARLAELRGLGIETRTGDLKDPASLQRACEGVQAVISTASCTLSRAKGDNLETVDRAGQLALVAAARRAGVKRFIFVSVSPNLKETSMLVRAKREVERAVQTSGMSWTILQPANFMEIWFGPKVGWDIASGVATMFGNGKAPVSWICARDVAAYAVVTVDDPRASSRLIPLGGLESLAPWQVVQAFESTLGRPFRSKRVPISVPWLLRTLLRPFSQVAASIMDLAFQTSLGDVIDMRHIEWEFGIKGTTIREYVERTCATPRDQESTVASPAAIT